MQPVLFVVPVLAALAIWLVLREGMRQEKDRRRLQALGQRAEQVAVRCGRRAHWAHGPRRGMPVGPFALRRLDRRLRSLEAALRLRVPAGQRRMAFADPGDILDRLEERVARIEGAVSRDTGGARPVAGPSVSP